MVALTATAWAAVLAAAAVACWVRLPKPGELRLGGLHASPPAARSAPPRWLAVALVAVPALLLFGPVVAALALLAVAVAQRTRERRRCAADRRAERRRAVEACAALAGELRAGRSPGAALAVAAQLASGPSREVLRAAAAVAQLGGDVAGALLVPESSPGGRVPPITGRPGTATAVPEVLRALAACWAVCAVSGSGLASAVERLEEGLRADADRRRAVEAELAGPRATAGMLAVLPLAGLLLATGLGADPAGVLLHTPLGLACLAGGLVFDGLGLLWTNRLVDRAGGSS